MPMTSRLRMETRIFIARMRDKNRDNKKIHEIILFTHIHNSNTLLVGVVYSLTEEENAQTVMSRKHQMRLSERTGLSEMNPISGKLWNALAAVDSSTAVAAVADELTVEQVLDVPEWADHELLEARFPELNLFEEFTMECEHTLQQELVTYDYNTFTAFVRMYRNYRRAADHTGVPLIDYLSKYRSRVERDSMSCVGMSVALVKRLRQQYPRFARSVGLVSCEEAVRDAGAYSIKSANNVKEHNLVCVRVLVEGRRRGYVLLDPGYHVSRPIVVMEDKQYPHTGWFTSSSNPKVRKDYCYELLDDQYIGWRVKEWRNGVLEEWMNLVYVKKAFAKCLTITEKRSLIYAMKSLVVRNRKGPVAGLYSWLETKSVTLFYEENGCRVQKKVDVGDIAEDNETLRQMLVKIVCLMTGVTDVDARVRQLMATLCEFREAAADHHFMPQLAEIDKWIEEEDESDSESDDSDGSDEDTDDSDSEDSDGSVSDGEEY
ncbi:unnamed protein product [Medioppia subpectinata]|uniref:Uncharacterized protein n=1 Tax=Medioppia subpectinata TaxID=1979941 RepID=A0A7R9KZJ9_9ACAR|nr:unnamed protein product [Medioppia subpectinata]CAG2111483.1 unnamed protein product [Medioppia subpectinata]